MSVTSTRTHTFVSFANPHLLCDSCGEPVSRWHDPERCGCQSGLWNEPCRHLASATSACPSWSPVDGCRCPDPHIPSKEKTDD